MRKVLVAMIFMFPISVPAQVITNLFLETFMSPARVSNTGTTFQLPGPVVASNTANIIFGDFFGSIAAATGFPISAIAYDGTNTSLVGPLTDSTQSIKGLIARSNITFQIDGTNVTMDIIFAPLLYEGTNTSLLGSFNDPTQSVKGLVDGSNINFRADGTNVTLDVVVTPLNYDGTNATLLAGFDSPTQSIKGLIGGSNTSLRVDGTNITIDVSDHTILETFTWVINGGVPASDTEFDGFRTASRAGTIRSVVLSLVKKGRNGSTIVDLNLFTPTNTITVQQSAVPGVTVYTTQANRPTLLGEDATRTDNTTIQAPLPDITNFVAGCLFAPDIDSDVTQNDTMTLDVTVEYNGP